MGQLDGLSGIITGGGSGLGKAAAERFAKEGATVLVADVNESAGREVAEGIEHGHFGYLDVTSKESAKELVAQAVKELGRIDYLVNCAGIARVSSQWANGGWRPMEELEEEAWDRIIEVNLKGTFLMDQTVGLQMIKQQSGTIVNVASLSGVVANKGMLGHGAYCSSKAGVISLTQVLATEWAQHSIRVNAISPAYMDTGMVERAKSMPGIYEMHMDMTPMRRYGQPHEFADVVLFLASSQSTYITGHNLLMDGGYTAW